MNNLPWQSKGEPQTNPLQKISEALAFDTETDFAGNKTLAIIYGIAVGWDDKSYEELKIQHGWSERDIADQKMWKFNYRKSWKIFIEENSKILNDHTLLSKLGWEITR